MSKKIVFDSIDLHTFISLTFFLDLTHIHNFGISFGLFSGLISPWLLIIIGLLVVGFIFYLMKSASDMFEEWSFLIISELYMRWYLNASGGLIRPDEKTNLAP